MFHKICTLKEYFENGYSAYKIYSDVDYHIVDENGYAFNILYFIKESREGSGLVFCNDNGYVRAYFENDIEDFSEDSYIGIHTETYSEIERVTKEFSNGYRFDNEKAVKEIINLRKNIERNSTL